jgi:uncharacterized protein (TIGR00297 family)
MDLLGGILVASPAALIAWQLRFVTFGGAAAGFVCAVAIYLGAMLAGIAVLGVALGLTAVSSRVRLERKMALGIAEDGRGQRGARSVLANCGVAAIAGLLSAFSSTWSGEVGAVMLVAALAAGASDTVASEIGKAFGARPRAFPSWRPVRPGTPGAVSISGTAAGLAAAVIISWPAIALWLLPADRVPLIVFACAAGSLLESALATGFEERRLVGNDVLNVLNTAAAAGIAGWWVS